MYRDTIILILVIALLAEEIRPNHHRESHLAEAPYQVQYAPAPGRVTTTLATGGGHHFFVLKTVGSENRLFPTGHQG